MMSTRFTAFPELTALVLAGFAPSQVAWQQLSPSSSPGIVTGLKDAPIAYDAFRDRVVLVRDAGGPAVETWEFDGKTWLQRRPNRPPSLGSSTSERRFLLVYDSARRHVVLIRSDISGSVDETWSWNGSVWNLLGGTPKPPRLFSTVAFDEARGEIVLFSGQAKSNSSVGRMHPLDTWTWDGTRWTKKTPSRTPPGRNIGLMAYDARRQRVVLFGGHDNVIPRSPAFDDTWEWDGQNWHQRMPANRPNRRTGSSMVYDAGRGRIVVYGGNDGIGFPSFRDTWEWNGGDWMQRPTAAAPTASNGLLLAYDTARERVIAYGGATLSSTSVTRHDETWIYGATRPGTVRHPGGGCRGAHGVPLLLPATALRPYIGDVFPLRLTNLSSGTGWAVLALGAQQTPAIPLLPLGMPGCAWHVATTLAVATPTNGGELSFALAVPPSQTLVGTEFASQALVVDPQANAAGVVTSDAVFGRVGAK